ncbi:dolichyl-diphosphooligosaccharide---protein glycosyltransferase [Nematocida sp. AWRm77]|nr:dolichyl-diphosphooligosaccharide---protein glycosyltransferase [Nematocida sp. AWRm77]
MIDGQRTVLGCISWGMLGWGALARLRPLWVFGETINEFDPWFNYRCSEYMWVHGIRKYFSWKDDKTWVPVGRDIPATAFPLFPIFTNCVHKVLEIVGVWRLSHYQVCSLMPVLCFALCAVILWKIAALGFSEDAHAEEKAVLAVGMFGVAGGVLEKTISGAFDYEGLSLVCVLLIVHAYAVYLKKKALSPGLSTDILCGVWAGALQALFAAAWGGSVFTEVLLAVHACMFVECGVFFAVCTGVTLCGTSVFPFTKTFDLVLLGKIGALCFIVMTNLLKKGNVNDKGKGNDKGKTNGDGRGSVNDGDGDNDREKGKKGKKKMVMVMMKGAGKKYLYSAGCLGAGCAVLLGGAALGTSAAREKALKFLQSSKVYNLFFRQTQHPLVQSIAEHKAPSVNVLLLLAGPFFFFFPFIIGYHLWKHKKAADFSVQAFFAAGAVFSSCLFLRMERFAFLVSPFLSLLAASWSVDALRSWKGRKEVFYFERWVKYFAKGVTGALLCLYVASTLLGSLSLSSNVVIMSPGVRRGKPFVMDDFREAAMYLKYNTQKDSVVLSWWDYGYQITGMSGRATVVDNNTNNYSRISEVAQLLVLPEKNASWAHPLIKSISKNGTRSVLLYVVCGAVSKYPSADLNKLPWIAKIAQHENSRIAPEAYYFSVEQSPLVATSLCDLVNMDPVTHTLYGRSVYLSPALKNSLLFQLTYAGYDPSVVLHNFELLFQSRDHIVRIFKLKSIH